MKTELKIFTAVVFLLIVGGCAKESEADAGLSDKGNLLLTEEKVNGITELSFEYNDLNQVSAYHIHSRDGSGVHTGLFTYNNKGLMTVVTHSQGGQHVYREEYSYGSGDKPISGVLTYPHAVVTVQYNYTQNTVKETTFANGEQLSVNTYTFDNKGENIVKTVITGGGLLQSTLEYGDYDNKYFRLTNYPWKWKTSSINNARSYKLNAQGVDGGVTSLDQIWKYTYNDAGYPITAEIYNRGSDEIVETRTYSYIPAN